MSTTRALTTADELFAMPDDGMRRELVRGKLRTTTPAGYEHGKIVGRLTGRVQPFVESRDLGDILGAETGFRIAGDPDTVLAPDLAFVAKHRVPVVHPTRGYGRATPDLVAEVVSPNDSYEEVEEKVLEWLGAGTSIVWVVNPRTRTVTVHDRSEGMTILSAHDELTGGAVLPGFSFRVGELFP